MYGWSSQSDSVATIKHGVVTMVANGTSLVRAFDVKNSLHYDQSEVCCYYGIMVTIVIWDIRYM